MAASRRSSAVGLFQFVEQTWLLTLRRYGSAHGYGREADLIRLEGSKAVLRDAAERDRVLKLRADPWLSAHLAGELTKENQRALRRALSRPASDGEVYAAHFLGVAGAIRLIQASERTPFASASAVLPQAAAANPQVFRRNGRSLTASELLMRLAHGW